MRQDHRVYFRTRRRILSVLAAALVGLPATVAIAHHGWSGYGTETFSLTGTVESVSLANPHGLIKLRAPDGIWDALLAPPNQTKSAGVIAGVVKVGATVTARGRRSTDPNKREMKTERLLIGDKTYNIYPDRPSS